MLDNEERLRIIDNFDVYDLVEILGLTARDILDAFDSLVEDNEEIMERIGSA